MTRPLRDQRHAALQSGPTVAMEREILPGARARSAVQPSAPVCSLGSCPACAGAVRSWYSCSGGRPARPPRRAARRCRPASRRVRWASWRPSVKQVGWSPAHPFMRLLCGLCAGSPVPVAQQRSAQCSAANTSRHCLSRPLSALPHLVAMLPATQISPLHRLCRSRLACRRQRSAHLRGLCHRPHPNGHRPAPGGGVQRLLGACGPYRLRAACAFPREGERCAACGGHATCAGEHFFSAKQFTGMQPSLLMCAALTWP